MRHHGNDPQGEPTDLIVRASVEGQAGAPDGHDPVEVFQDANRLTISQLRRDLSQQLPEGVRLDLDFEGGSSDNQIRETRSRGPRQTGKLTPVMARLGPGELEIADTLVSTGIAANRAEAIRWALTRIRERPAYEQLRERAREIECLKDEF